LVAKVKARVDIHMGDDIERTQQNAITNVNRRNL